MPTPVLTPEPNFFEKIVDECLAKPVARGFIDVFNWGADPAYEYTEEPKYPGEPKIGPWYYINPISLLGIAYGLCLGIVVDNFFNALQLTLSICRLGLKPQVSAAQPGQPQAREAFTEGLGEDQRSLFRIYFFHAWPGLILGLALGSLAVFLRESWQSASWFFWATYIGNDGDAVQKKQADEEPEQPDSRATWQHGLGVLGALVGLVAGMIAALISTNIRSLTQIFIPIYNAGLDDIEERISGKTIGQSQRDGLQHFLGLPGALLGLISGGIAVFFSDNWKSLTECVRLVNNYGLRPAATDHYLGKHILESKRNKFKRYIIGNLCGSTLIGLVAAAVFVLIADNINALIRTAVWSINKIISYKATDSDLELGKITRINGIDHDDTRAFGRKFFIHTIPALVVGAVIGGVIGCFIHLKRFAKLFFDYWKTVSKGLINVCLEQSYFDATRREAPEVPMPFRWAAIILGNLTAFITTGIIGGALKLAWTALTSWVPSIMLVGLGAPCFLFTAIVTGVVSLCRSSEHKFQKSVENLIDHLDWQGNFQVGEGEEISPPPPFISDVSNNAMKRLFTFDHPFTLTEKFLDNLLRAMRSDPDNKKDIRALCNEAAAAVKNSIGFRYFTGNYQKAKLTADLENVSNFVQQYVLNDSKLIEVPANLYQQGGLTKYAKFACSLFTYKKPVEPASPPATHSPHSPEGKFETYISPSAIPPPENFAPIPASIPDSPFATI